MERTNRVERLFMAGLLLAMAACSDEVSNFSYSLECPSSMGKGETVAVALVVEAPTPHENCDQKPVVNWTVDWSNYYGPDFQVSGPLGSFSPALCEKSHWKAKGMASKYCQCKVQFTANVSGGLKLSVSGTSLQHSVKACQVTVLERPGDGGVEAGADRGPDLGPTDQGPGPDLAGDAPVSDLPNPCSAGLIPKGCCKGTVLYGCEGASLISTDCGNVIPALKCGWSAVGGMYQCGTSDAGDPSGTHKRACPF